MPLNSPAYSPLRRMIPPASAAPFQITLSEFIRIITSGNAGSAGGKGLTARLRNKVDDEAAGSDADSTASGGSAAEPDVDEFDELYEDDEGADDTGDQSESERERE